MRSKEGDIRKKPKDLEAGSDVEESVCVLIFPSEDVTHKVTFTVRSKTKVAISQYIVN